MKPWRMQKFFGDLVYDLRSRNLLPIVIALAVAVVAVPVLILRGSDEAPPPEAVAAVDPAELAPELQAAAVAYDPGLRDYRERLGELQSKDPFRQHFSSTAGGGAALGEAVATTLGATTGEASTTTSGGGTGSSGGTGSGSKAGGTPQTRYYSYETDVAVGSVGGELQRRNRIDVFSFLPSEKAPVLVFLGNTGAGGKVVATFLVADDVTGIEGGGDCFPSPDSCQLLALKPGATADLTWAGDSQAYRIKVVRVELVTTKKPPKR